MSVMEAVGMKNVGIGSLNVIVTSTADADIVMEQGNKYRVNHE